MQMTVYPACRYMQDGLVCRCSPSHRFSAAGRFFVGLLLFVQLTGCTGPLRERVLFERGDIQIGLETDLSAERTVINNAHPYEISVQDMRTLLGSVEVSGWSGAILGLFQDPRPFPVFTVDELDVIAGPVAQAFQQADRKERVFFSIPGKQKPYPSEKDKIAGALFFRDQYLHMILTDHYAFTAADPGGGEERDPRDTKGMKLWAASPARAAIVPQDQEPKWTAFEKVHISLNPQNVLIARGVQPAGPPTPMPVASTMPQNTAAQPKRAEAVPNKTAESSSDDLRLQIKELTNSNLDLRNRLKEQAAELQALREELDRLRKQIKPRSTPKPLPKNLPQQSAP